MTPFQRDYGLVNDVESLRNTSASRSSVEDLRAQICKLERELSDLRFGLSIWILLLFFCVAFLAFKLKGLLR